MAPTLALAPGPFNFGLQRDSRTFLGPEPFRHRLCQVAKLEGLGRGTSTRSDSFP